MVLRPGQSLVSQEYHALRRSSLVVRQMSSSSLAATKSMSSVLKIKKSRQVIYIECKQCAVYIDHVFKLQCRAPHWGKITLLWDCVLGFLLQAVLQFPCPVSDLVESHDKQLLYVACSSGVYCVSVQYLLSRYKPMCSTFECNHNSWILFSSFKSLSKYPRIICS